MIYYWGASNKATFPKHTERQDKSNDTPNAFRDTEPVDRDMLSESIIAYAIKHNEALSNDELENAMNQAIIRN